MIDRIHVCSPIRFSNICRNEVKDVISARRAKTVMEKGQGELYLTASESIQQRTAMVLRNVQHYVIDAHFDMADAAAPGWAPAKISFALYLNESGELTQIVSTTEEGTKGKKSVMQPQLMVLLAAVKRTVSIASNFLWDNSAYLRGIDQKGKPERSRECFAAAAALHHAVLDSVDSPNARVILAFFDTWESEHAAEHPVLIRQLDDVTAGGNLVFRVDGRKVEEDVSICEAWQRYRNGGESGVKMQCLVTGKEDEIAAVHPSVKGVRDAQSSGAALKRLADGLPCDDLGVNPNRPLNEDCNYMPYLLGRLFRVMEEIQLASTGWNVNRSIKDSHFNSAASTPRSVFHKLFSLSNYHLKKLMRDKNLHDFPASKRSRML